MFDESLLLLLDEVRGKTLRLLQDVTGKDARWFPPGLHNHVLWHAGHSYPDSGIQGTAPEATPGVCVCPAAHETSTLRPGLGRDGASAR